MNLAQLSSQCTHMCMYVENCNSQGAGRRYCGPKHGATNFHGAPNSSRRQLEFPASGWSNFWTSNLKSNARCSGESAMRLLRSTGRYTALAFIARIETDVLQYSLRYWYSAGVKFSGSALGAAQHLRYSRYSQDDEDFLRPDMPREPGITRTIGYFVRDQWR